MLRTIDKDVTRTANGEKLEEIIQGRSDIKRRLVRATFEQVNATYFRVYVDQDKIVDIASENNALDYQWLEIDRDLENGEVVKVGFYDEIGASAAQHVAVQIEEI